MQVKPLYDRVLVKRLDSEERTAGGIIIPDSAKEKPVQGEIVAVGSGKRDEHGKPVALEVKVGDKVIFSRYGGTEIKVGDKEMLILREEDILGIIEA